ncbi:hypothetical protein [Mesorhizobium delmotii]|uniref:hypothetical protein n=1 Tax=Mesorhizobium delmotii TaxID=1631247 RepID=UPI000F439D69|nr:hypothetical protein [Mesorhizobium delmotii]
MLVKSKTPQTGLGIHGQRILVGSRRELKVLPGSHDEDLTVHRNQGNVVEDDLAEFQEHLFALGIIQRPLSQSQFGIEIAI